jgi:hypothetical protein
MSAADDIDAKQARKRERERESRQLSRARAEAGLAVLKVVVPAGDTGDLLREAGFIHPLSEDTPAILAAGIEKMIEVLLVTRDATDFEIVPR